jgi:hypothetical protein
MSNPDLLQTAQADVRMQTAAITKEVRSLEQHLQSTIQQNESLTIDLDKFFALRAPLRIIPDDEGGTS